MSKIISTNFFIWVDWAALLKMRQAVYLNARLSSVSFINYVYPIIIKSKLTWKFQLSIEHNSKDFKVNYLSLNLIFSPKKISIM